MKKYLITLECCDLITETVEANNEDEAFKIAEMRSKGQVTGDNFVLRNIEVIRE